MPNIENDPYFLAIHSATICLNVEIDYTVRVTKDEFLYRLDSGHETQIEILTEFNKIYQKRIIDPFNKEIWDKMMDLDKDYFLDSMDFMFAYKNLVQIDFFKEIHLATKIMRKHFSDSYKKYSIYEWINEGYPGISHNELVYPHETLWEIISNPSKFSNPLT